MSHYNSTDENSIPEERPKFLLVLCILTWVSTGFSLLAGVGRLIGGPLSAEKMKEAAYVDIPAADIPLVNLTQQSFVKVIAGETELNGKTVRGPIFGLSTEPLYLDVQLEAGQSLTLPVTAGHNAYVYPFEGEVFVEGLRVANHHGAVLTDGDSVTVSAKDKARFILLAAKPIKEPVVQYGPFVMNKPEEIEQAIRDYQAGTLTNNQQAKTIAIHKSI